MAALTTVPAPDDTVLGGVLTGCKFRQFGITTNAASTSTWASGIDGIVQLGWLGDATTDLVVPTWSGSTITFTNASASAFTGTLFIWSAS